MPVDVFLSVGRASTDAQERFIEGVERCLLDQDLHPRTLGRNEWSSVQPLQAVRERMEQCSGAAVVAFERTRIGSGTEDERDISDEVLPTVWNQIEATMAYSLGKPLLVIGEEGLRSEGLLESRYDWFVQWLPLKEEALRTPECMGVIEDWKKRVLREQTSHEAAPPHKDVGDKTIGELLGELRPGQARALVLGIIGVIAAAFSPGVTLGS
jgi:hypothetical protein